jgi:CHAT domain-containing protein
VLGRDHPDTLSSVNNLAGLYRATGRFEKAEPLYERALEGRERVLGRDHPDTLGSVNNLAALYDATGRFAEAEPLYERALEGRERVLGRDHPDTLSSVNNLAGLYQATGRFDEAEPLYERALEGYERVLGRDHPDTLISLWSYFSNRAKMAQRGLPIAPRLAQADELLRGLLTEAGRTFDARTITDADLQLLTSPATRARNILAAYRAALNAGDIPATDALADIAFSLSQSFAGSSTDEALQEARQRLAVDEPEARAALASRDQALLDLSEAEPQLANAQAADPPQPERVTYWQRKVEEYASELRSANAIIERVDPDLANLTVSRTIDARSVRETLNAGEAVILYSFAPRNDDLIAFVVTQDSIAAIPLAVPRASLAGGVRYLRGQLTPPTTKSALINQPFDLEVSKRLYDLIVAPLQPYLQNISRVFVVADGALEVLPLHLLVTELPGDEALTDFDRYRATGWLGDQYAFVRLPAIASLTALRRDKPENDTERDRSLIAFADPLLGNEVESDGLRIAEASDDEIRLLGGDGSAATLAELPPVPGTRDLAVNVAAALQARARDVFLGDEALEEELWVLNERDNLSRYRSILFATHALIAGDKAFPDLSEPAIVLTPEGDIGAGGRNDGLLRASEAVFLKLNADLVILAACNTAAPDGSPQAEALSGLAKSFFYAGAKGLLVSNWPAAEKATATLIPEMVNGMEQGDMAPAEALQAAMQAVRNSDDPENFYWSHPAIWAPFMLVGEGAGRS